MTESTKMEPYRKLYNNKSLIDNIAKTNYKI